MVNIEGMQFNNIMLNLESIELYFSIMENIAKINMKKVFKFRKKK